MAGKPGITSNIFVSAARGHPSDEGRGDKGYRKQHLTWLISVEPHKHALPLLPQRTIERVHYVAIRTDGHYKLEKHPNHDIIGSVLVAEKAHIDAEKLHAVVEEGLKGLSPSSESSSDDDTDDASELWLRKALHVLQQHKYTQSSFEVGKFMTFAHGYMASRTDDGDMPSTITYAPLFDKDQKSHDPAKDDHQKKPRFGFWVSHPMSKVQRHIDEESRPYGGLM
ncbi:hypothetical protein BAUCODRAFT_22026 [Baudoinia panamericana UAMH 10762]|uniref:Uncharacterized protein n=1 Tax=Baudoinia panamericana (strain UAMH 10762) TaxID=717646 RepID=M2LVI5_BAUPA|nr:uncharacterized protein BAUCODRAFT_22026 [Baudoinia panamericana UAMH 10762]EMC98657.1 hypothetical protein BAUCODRAFT_22026 [Baudoinia panamericana UAMH 10762]